jgi:hypothetical protein
VAYATEGHVNGNGDARRLVFFKFLWMNKFIAKPGITLRIKGLKWPSQSTLGGGPFERLVDGRIEGDLAQQRSTKGNHGSPELLVFGLEFV